MGMSTAYYLTLQGKRVLILEAGIFGAGASGACDDMILFQSKKPGINLELAFESLELYHALNVDLKHDLGFENYGGMVLIKDQKELEIMEEFVQQQRMYGLDVVMLDEKEMRKRQPHISSRFIASTYSPMDAQIDPFHVMYGFFHVAKNLGLEYRKKTPVVGIEKQGNGDFRITTQSGEVFEATQVVNAAGTWAGEIAAMVGENVPITPKRGQIIITEKIPMVGETNLWSAEYLVSKLRPEVKTEISEEHKALGLGFAFTRSFGGNYLIGSTREYAGFDTRTTMEGVNAIVKQAVSYIPLLKDIHFIRAIAGLRPSTPDGKMILGEHPDVPGFYTASGHEGDGISLAPITGKLLSDMMCGAPSDSRLEELSPVRFAVVKGEQVQ